MDIPVLQCWHIVLLVWSKKQAQWKCRIFLRWYRTQAHRQQAKQIRQRRQKKSPKLMRWQRSSRKSMRNWLKLIKWTPRLFCPILYISQKMDSKEWRKIPPIAKKLWIGFVQMQELLMGFHLVSMLQQQLQELEQLATGQMFTMMIVQQPKPLKRIWLICN